MMRSIELFGTVVAPRVASLLVAAPTADLN